MSTKLAVSSSLVASIASVLGGPQDQGDMNRYAMLLSKWRTCRFNSFDHRDYREMQYIYEPGTEDAKAIAGPFTPFLPDFLTLICGARSKS